MHEYIDKCSLNTAFSDPSKIDLWVLVLVMTLILVLRYSTLQELAMPALSPTMSQGNIAKWYVKEGDEVSAGSVLADIETDKATMSFENQEDG